MSWVKLSDNYYDHPKLVEAGWVAELLWVRGLAYANRFETDGALPAHIRRTLGAQAAHNKVSDATLNRAVQRLIACALWERTADGYQIHDFHDYQPSKAEMQQRRAKTAAKVAKWRAEHKASGNGHGNPVSNPVTDDAAEEPW